MRWLTCALSRSPSRQPRRRPAPRRPTLEQLEDRLTPSTLIPVSNRRDLVFDPTRDLLYITTSSGQVQRYDVAGQTLLAPYNVGTSLNGADITPDGSTLLVAENQTSGSQGVLHEVDLDSGGVTDVTYNLAFAEGGTWDVAAADNGKAFFSTRFLGSGWVPFRQLDLTTGAVTIRTDTPGSGGGGQVTQDTHIDRSADGSQLFMAESNISSGPIFTYDAASDTFPQHAQTNAFYYNTTAAVSRGGSLIATQLGYGPAFYYGVSVMDKNFHSVRTLAPNFNGGLTFDPTRDLLYVADASADQVVAFDTNTWAEKFRLAIGEPIPAATPFGSGEMTVSSDGTELFLSTPSGVRMIDLPANPGVVSGFVVGGFPGFTGAGNPGTFTVTAVDSFGNPVPGYTGTVHFSSTDPSAQLPDDYPFTPDDNGSHTFTATFNTPGTYTLRAEDAGNPGLFGAQTNIVIHDSNPVSLIPVTNHRDLVFDEARGLLYITTADGLVQRYDVASQTLLAPWRVGASLYGADITPGGSFLYTSEGVRGATQGMLHKVNLDDGTVTNLTYNLAFYEGGTWAVAVAANGEALFDARFEGSGWVPLRQLDTATDTLTVRTDDPGSGFGGEVRQDTHIRRGGDRSLLFFMESNISSGPIFDYDAASDTFPRQQNTGLFLDGSLASVSRDGSLIAMNVGTNVRVLDRNLAVMTTLAGLGGGLVFDPARDVLYAANSTQIIGYDTHTWAEEFRIDIGQAVPASAPFGNGEMTVSDDGQWLFLATPTGVRVYPLGAPASAGGAGGASREVVPELPGGGSGAGPSARGAAFRALGTAGGAGDSSAPALQPPGGAGGAGLAGRNAAEGGVGVAVVILDAPPTLVASLRFAARLPAGAHDGDGIEWEGLPPVGLTPAAALGSGANPSASAGADARGTFAKAGPGADPWAEVFGWVLDPEVNDLSACRGRS
jgi:hypothetical protein